MQSSHRPLDSIEEFKKLPAKELYRLIVDGRFHAEQRGFEGYAMREPNSVPAALTSLQVALTNLDNKDISVPFINKIHESAMSKVEDTNNSKSKAGVFRKKDFSGFHLSEGMKSVTVAGLNEFQNAIRIGSLPGAVLTIINKDYFKGMRTEAEYDKRLSPLENITDNLGRRWQEMPADKEILYLAPPAKELLPLMTEVCSRYNEEIRRAEEDEEKLRIIAETIQQIAHIHAYLDGNIRVSLILMQRLLLQNSFLPVMLNDPNCIDGYSVDELVTEIKSGMANTKQLIDHPEDELFDYQTPQYKSQKPDAESQSEEDYFRTAIISDVLRAERNLHRFVQDISKGLEPKASIYNAKSYQLGRFFTSVEMSPTERKIILTLQNEDAEGLKIFHEANPEKFSHHLVPAILKLYAGSKKDYYSKHAAVSDRHKAVKEKFIDAVKMSLPYLDQTTRQRLLNDLQQKEDKSKFLTASRDTGIKGFLGSFKPSQSWQQITALLAEKPTFGK